MKKEKLKQLAHLFAGFILLLQGFNWFESGISISISLYLLLAVTVLLVAGMHKWVQKHFTSGDSAFFLFEAAAFLYAAVTFREDGGNLMWVLYALFAVAYVAFATVALFDNNERWKRSRNRRRRRRRRSMSSSLQ
ncbi:hypothetical protein [Aridibaculum aurantiacum]|uniref:hypothetical protein n=1 Tax=Aridibaculum aurantiacum TaxID=2810307 RepID=UPI001A977031|nr:hypothetical protein [Aridibaculum aurantiacum]